MFNGHREVLVSLKTYGKKYLVAGCFYGLFLATKSGALKSNNIYWDILLSRDGVFFSQNCYKIVYFEGNSVCIVYCKGTDIVYFEESNIAYFK